MKYRDQQLSSDLRIKLIEFNKEIPLPGLDTDLFRECFISQLVDSIRRISFYSVVSSRSISERRADPSSETFDPIRAAMLNINSNVNEAYWLAFLSVHFGKNKNTGWSLVRSFYGKLGDEGRWSWDTVTLDFDGFARWMQENEYELKLTGKFGNHRKYETLKSHSLSGSIYTLESYIQWIGNDHPSKFTPVINLTPENPRQIFDHLYRSMHQVKRFGRTAKFDYLTTLGKLGLLPIEPGKTYMQDATGPLYGARLLFGGTSNANISKPDLEELLHLLEAFLALPFGMQVLEDSLCNWQKSPGNYQYFSG